MDTSQTGERTAPNRRQGAVSIRKTVLPGMAIPMLKIRRPNGRLIFNMEIAKQDTGDKILLHQTRDENTKYNRC